MSDGGEEMPDLGDWGDDGGGPVESFEASPSAADEQPEEAGGAFELVSQPSKVAKVDIGYAKVAKQVDISALKRGLWELLADDEDASSSSDAATRRMSSEASFQQIVARLPEKIPARRLPDISISYNFICLLHLANEHGLEIVGQESLDDLRISQPAQEKPAKAKPAKAKPAKA